MGASEENPEQQASVQGVSVEEEVHGASVVLRFAGMEAEVSGDMDTGPGDLSAVLREAQRGYEVFQHAPYPALGEVPAVSNGQLQLDSAVSEVPYLGTLSTKQGWSVYHP